MDRYLTIWVLCCIWMCPRYTIWTDICQCGSSTVSGCALDTPSGEISDARTVTASPDAVSACNGLTYALSKRDMISGIEVRDKKEGERVKPMFGCLCDHACACGGGSYIINETNATFIMYEQMWRRRKNVDHLCAMNRYPAAKDTDAFSRLSPGTWALAVGGRLHV